MDLVWLLSGLALLILGAEGLVRGGVSLARRLGVNPLLIGVTVVAWAHRPQNSLSLSRQR